MDKRFGLKTHCIKDITTVLKLQPEVEEAIIFGSRAMGTYKNGSDIDIALKGEKINFDTISTIRLRLEELPYLYMYDIIDYKKVSNLALTAHIEELGITFYQKEKRPNDWETYNLSELVEIKYGKDHKHLADGDIPLYGSGGIMRYVDTPLYEQESILIPRKGTLSNLFYLNIPFWSVDTMFYTKIKEGNSGKYLYYLLKSMDLDSMNVGSAVPSLTTEILNKIELKLPDLSTQKQIAKILSSLDDKIELNLKINKTLEAMAQAIFKEWFVDFNFPNFDGELINGLPKGWRMGKFEEFTDIKTGKGLKKTEFKPNGLYPVIGANGELGRTDKYLLDEQLLLTGRVETLGSIKISYGKKWYSDNVLIMKPYKFFYCSYFILKRIDMNSLNRGSTQPLLTQTDLKNYIVLIPNIGILLSFENLMNKMFEKIFFNEIQIQTLTQIRDTLLPKLMNGQLEITN